MRIHTIVLVALSVSLFVGCNLDDEATLINQPANNANNTMNNSSNNRNNTNNSNNITNNSNGGPLVPTVQAFQNCAAGGVARGDGISAITCTGSTDTAGFEARGGDVIWQPGASSVLLIQ